MRARSSTSRSSSRHLQSLSPQRCRTSRTTASLRAAVSATDLQQSVPCTAAACPTDTVTGTVVAAAATTAACGHTLSTEQLNNTSAEHSENTEPAVCDDGRAACTICSRRFALDRIEKHQTVCATLCTSESVRGVFDSSKQRLAGLDECSLLSAYSSSSSRLQYRSRSYSPPPLRGVLRASHSSTFSQTSYSNTVGNRSSSSGFMQHGAADAQCFGSSSSSAVFGSSSSTSSILPAWNEQCNGRTARQRCQTSLDYSSSNSFGSGTVRAMIGSHSAIRLPNPW
jgi:zinc-finger of a C2HC-type